MIFIGQNGDLFVSGQIIISGAFPDALQGTQYHIYPGSYYPGYNECSVCGKSFGSIIGDTVNVTGVSGLYVQFCWKCAGFNYQKGGFSNREDWIREESGLLSGVPVQILSDWCLDNNRIKDSEYLLSCRSGQ